MSTVLQKPREDNMSVLAASIKELASQVHQAPRTPLTMVPISPSLYLQGRKTALSSIGRET